MTFSPVGPSVPIPELFVLEIQGEIEKQKFINLPEPFRTREYLRMLYEIQQKRDAA